MFSIIFFSAVCYIWRLLHIHSLITTCSILVRESHRGWGNYFQRLSEQGFWQSDKPGKEDDVECRQSSLAGAIEATK